MAPTCPACASDLLDSARFCGTCGVSVPRVCAGCMARLGEGHRFCSQCGLAQDGAAAAPGNPAFLSTGTDRRLMTVLFCDLVGSSALAVRLDPEDLATLLVAYRECCAGCITRHGGYVSRYVGDGILACFGYPRAMGRDAQSAVACGLEIARRIPNVLRSPMLSRLGQLAVRVGIESGLVIAGSLGPSWIGELDSLVGVAPNTAAHLQKLAVPGGVVIGEAAHELVANDFDCEELPHDALRELQPFQRAFAARRPIELRQKLLGRTAHKTSMVGRAPQLARLTEYWARTSRGQGQVALVCGEPGIGKSRLVDELLATLTDTPHNAVRLFCAAQMSKTAFHPILQSLRDALDMTSEDSDDLGRATPLLLTMLSTIGFTQTPVLDVLIDALGLRAGPADSLPPSLARRSLLVQVLQRWLLHSSGGIPLLILVEDLHWADPSTLELLQGLTDTIPGAAVMLVATCRSDFVVPWPEKVTANPIVLRPLGRAEAERMLDGIELGHGGAIREAILARAEGVPLFLEEFAVALSMAAVPRSVQQLLTSRLDALGPARALAQCASVLGREVDLEALIALAGSTPDGVEAQIAYLVECEILVRGNSLAGASYIFRHVLLQQAAYESMLLSNRKKLHSRAAELLSTLRPALAERQPEIIAEHHAAAGENAQAVPLFLRAATRDRTAAAFAEAENHVQRGLALVGSLAPAMAADFELQLQLLLGLILIARRGYASAAVLVAFEQASRVAERAPSQASALAPLRGLASFYQVRGPLSRRRRSASG